LSRHAAAHLVCHDAGELHRVVHDHLLAAGDDGARARRALWEFVRVGRLHDVLLLDQLLRLDEHGARRPPRPTFRELAAKYAAVPIADEADIRK
jgi:hypothetical protein